MTIARQPSVRCDVCWKRTEQGSAWMEDDDFRALLMERGWTRAPHASNKSLVQDVCPDCSPSPAPRTRRTPRGPLAPMSLAKVPREPLYVAPSLVPFTPRVLVSTN